MTGEPVNISERSHGLCVTGELNSGPDRMSSGISHELYVMEELDPIVMGEILCGRTRSAKLPNPSCVLFEPSP